MSENLPSRPLTAAELKALNLVRMFEEATDARQMIIRLEGTKEAAEAMYKLEEKLGVCKTLSVDFVPSTERYKIVLAIGEFQKYMFYMLKSVGMSLRMDGSLHTYDKLVVSNDYLNLGEVK